MKKLLLLVIYLLLFIGVANAQIRKATGTVISEDDGHPIIGATILVKGTQQGTVTDTEGRFSLNDIPEKNQILQISYVGMKTQEIPVKATLKIIMKPETEELEEVVNTFKNNENELSLETVFEIILKSLIFSVKSEKNNHESDKKGEKQWITK